MVSERKQKRVAYRQQVMRRLPLALLCAAALSFTLFLFTPMDIYAGNRTEFLFSFTDMGGWLLALALVGTMLFGALIALTPRRVSAVIAAVVFWLGVMGYAQGMFLNIGLKSLLGDGGAGDTPLWLYILDTALWVAAGVAAVLGALNMERKSWIRTAAGIALVVVLGMQVVGSVSIFGQCCRRHICRRRRGFRSAVCRADRGWRPAGCAEFPGKGKREEQGKDGRRQGQG